MENVNMITTPIEINKDILKFCEEIDSPAKPVFLEFFHVEGYICGDCYGNVEKHVEKNGGRVQYGWVIWEDHNIFLEAEFHAVWINNEGEYIDITPKADGEKRILFLPDSKRKFTGELIGNIRKALIDNAHNRARIKVAEKRFEIRKKYYKGSPEIEIPLFEEMNLERYARSVLQDEIRKGSSENIIKVGRNEPCPCGSGKKYKKCCGAS